MDNIDIADRTTLIDHIEENLWEMWSNFGRGPKCRLYESDDTLWFETPIPIIPLNAVLKFQVQSDIDQSIQAIVQHFRRKKVQFMWLIHPSARPSDLRDRLLRLGLIDVEPIIGMARRLDDLPETPALPEGIEIRKVVGKRDSSAYYHFASWRWNVPEQYEKQYEAIAKQFRFGQPDAKAQMWQAWRDDQPIAKAGIYFGSNSAGIYAVFTKPEARKLGLARILTLIALQEARSLGYRLAVLHSTPMAENVYQSIGFASIAEFRLFASDEVYI